MKVIATKALDNLVYIDESGIDNTEDYEYGYCKKGERFHALKSGVKSQRISMIAALNQKKIIAPLTFEGYCDTELFNAWFEQFLTPILQPGQTVILDNASFHKSKKSVSLPRKLVLKFFIFLHILLILMKLSTSGLPSKIELGKIFLALNLSAWLSILLFFNRLYYYEKSYKSRVAKYLRV